MFSEKDPRGRRGEREREKERENERPLHPLLLENGDPNPNHPNPNPNFHTNSLCSKAKRGHKTQDIARIVVYNQTHKTQDNKTTRHRQEAQFKKREVEDGHPARWHLQGMKSRTKSPLDSSPLERGAGRGGGCLEGSGSKPRAVLLRESRQEKEEAHKKGKTSDVISRREKAGIENTSSYGVRALASLVKPHLFLMFCLVDLSCISPSKTKTR